MATKRGEHSHLRAECPEKRKKEYVGGSIEASVTDCMVSSPQKGVPFPYQRVCLSLRKVLADVSLWNLSPRMAENTDDTSQGNLPDRSQAIVY